MIWSFEEFYNSLDCFAQGNVGHLDVPLVLVKLEAVFNFGTAVDVGGHRNWFTGRRPTEIQWQLSKYYLFDIILGFNWQLVNYNSWAIHALLLFCQWSMREFLNMIICQFIPYQITSEIIVTGVCLGMGIRQFGHTF